MKPADLIGNALFLPAMAGLALAAFAFFAGIIIAGGWLLEHLVDALSSALPRPAAFAAAVLFAVAIVTGLWHLLIDGRRRPPPLNPNRPD